ncbi:MAG TPA: response regulator [Acidimicrobiia bacterium]|nr:response regulator [Acidimicrobiia bacterium]
MSFLDDPELLELFHSEVEERAGRLRDAAAALGDSDVGRDLAHDMYREGHTIKGTARMMGFTAVSDAGKLLEETWRAILEHEIDDPARLSGPLAALAEAAISACSADPSAGTPALADGMRRVRLSLRGGDDEEIPVETVDAETPRGAPVEGGDLGGLLGAIDSWAFGETVRVNAASLFRLINGITSLRVDVEVLGHQVDEIGPASQERRDEILTGLSGSVAGAEKAVLALQDQALELASAPLSDITNTLPQLVRYLSRKSDKEIRFELVGDSHKVDRQVLEQLSDPLRQLLVNAVQHGIEPVGERIAAGKPPTGTLALRATVRDHRLEIVVEDDGRGIDWDAVRRSALRRGLIDPGAADDLSALRSALFAENFSTSGPGELVGDGNGLTDVAAAVESLHGNLTIDTEERGGTTVRLAVPTSRALQDAVLVRAGGQTWGVPGLAVLGRIPYPGGEPAIPWEGAQIPMASLAETVGLVETDPLTRVIVVTSPTGPVGLAVSEEIGRRQVASRELGPILGGVPHLTGAALLGGGDIVVLVDAARLADRVRAVPDASGPRLRILVIDDSRGARQVVGGALGSAGFEVELASSPSEALAALAEGPVDGIVMDFVLPTMTGAELVAKVREMGVDVPVVVLSGQATPSDQVRAIEAGADAYFDKDDVRKGALAQALSELIGDGNGP